MQNINFGHTIINKILTNIPQSATLHTTTTLTIPSDHYNLYKAVLPTTATTTYYPRNCRFPTKFKVSSIREAIELCSQLNKFMKGWN